MRENSNINKALALIISDIRQMTLFVIKHLRAV